MLSFLLTLESAVVRPRTVGIGAVLLCAMRCVISWCQFKYKGGCRFVSQDYLTRFNGMDWHARQGDYP